jgi:hypothetical protein
MDHFAKVLVKDAAEAMWRKVFDLAQNDGFSDLIKRLELEDYIPPDIEDLKEGENGDELFWNGFVLGGVYMVLRNLPQFADLQSKDTAE